MEMQEKKLKRFKVYSVIAKVLFIITIILGVLALITAFIAEGVLIVKGTELIDEFQSAISDMGFNITLPFTEIPHLTIITGFILLLAGIALTAYIFRSISKMFRSIVDNKTPFIPDNVKRIKSMGIGLFIFAGVQLILSSIMAYGLMDVIGKAGITDHSTINWTVIGFGVLLLALAEMFEYGASLQQDSTSIV